MSTLHHSTVSKPGQQYLPTQSLHCPSTLPTCTRAVSYRPILRLFHTTNDLCFAACPAPLARGCHVLPNPKAAPWSFMVPINPSGSSVCYQVFGIPYAEQDLHSPLVDVWSGRHSVSTRLYLHKRPDPPVVAVKHIYLLSLPGHIQIHLVLVDQVLAVHLAQLLSQDRSLGHQI